MPRVLLLLPTSTYRSADYLRAAANLGIEIVVAAEEPSALERLNPAGLMTIDFRDPADCERAAGDLAGRGGIDAAIGVDEETAIAAARIASALGLPRANPPDAVAAARDKRRLRERLAAAGLPGPAWHAAAVDGGPDAALERVRFPCVLKPTFLSGSRGVIRADSAEEFRAAWARVAAILAEPDVARRGGPSAREILLEGFVPGEEVAVEALLVEGRLEVLAIFDKPDPLDGPFFEETIYVTPSRQPAAVQASIARAVDEAARALGLRHGPVHAELRLSRVAGRSPQAGGVPVALDVAARTIGGLCGRALRFEAAPPNHGRLRSLEELVLRNALGVADSPAREGLASGVMMIPIPRAGTLEQVQGGDAARRVPGIEELVVSAHPGQRLVPLPEASRYLGFLFARAGRPEEVEAALREAHAKLEIVIGE